jgi:hypothetical protein
VLYAGSIDDCSAEAVKAYDSKLYLDLHGGGNGTDAIVATNCCIYLVDDTVEDVIGNGNIVMHDKGVRYNEDGVLITVAATRPAVPMTSNTAPAPYRASASGEASSDYRAWQAFNHDYSDAYSWVSESGSSRNNWVAGGFDKPIYVNKITLCNRTRLTLVNGCKAVDIWACPSMPAAGASLATAISEAILLASWNPESEKYNSACANMDGTLSAGVTEIELDGSIPVQYLLINPYDFEGYSTASYVAIGEIYTDGDGLIYA